MQSIKLFAVALVAAFALAAQASDPGPIRIGVTCPFSGGSSPMGISARDAVRLVVSEINWKGGLLGRKIELIERDDEANPARGRQIAQQLLNQDHVVATIGSCNTGVTLATLDLYQAAKVPLIVPVATGVEITRKYSAPAYPHSYIFRTSANDLIQAQMIAREAIEKRKLTKVAVLYDTTAYGKQGNEFLEQALDAYHVKPVAVASFGIGEKDMTAQLERARKAGAQALLTYGVGPELAVIANERAKMGWKVPMIGSWPLSWQSFLSAAGENAEGILMPQTFIAEPTTLKRTSFILGYLDAFKVQRIPSAISAAQAYDATLILAAAIKQAGSTDGPKIRAALENLKQTVYGVMTTYNHPFSPTDHEAVTGNEVVMGVVRKGFITFAYKADEKIAIIGHKREH